MKKLLTQPLELKDIAPKRYDFFASMLKKLYPEFDPLQNIEKMREYNKLLADLGYESVESALKSVETKLEGLKEK